MFKKFIDKYLTYSLITTLGIIVLAYMLMFSLGTSQVQKGDSIQAYFDGLSYTFGYALRDISMLLFIGIVTLVIQKAFSKKTYLPYINIALTVGTIANIMNTVSKAIFDPFYGYAPMTSYPLHRDIGVILAAILYAILLVGLFIKMYGFGAKIFSKKT